MRIFIIRHAWAEERDSQRWPDDGLRPLTKKGRKRFVKLVRRLQDGDFEPEVIATSPLVRCRQTADLLAEQFDAAEPPIVELDALAPGSDLETLIQWSNEHDVAQLAWVGHSPDVGDLLGELIGAAGEAFRYPKGAVACVDFDESIARNQGQLRWLATADLLGL